MSPILSRFIDFKRERNLSHKQIAEIWGVTQNAVTEVLSGRNKIQANYLANLIEAFQLDANYFFRKEVAEAEYQKVEATDFTRIPFLGHIAATFGRNSEELPEEGLMVPTFMLPKKRKYFALRVSGDSMIGAGILDGDICIIEPQNNPSILKDGDIAAFRVDGNTTLKYYRKQKDNSWLVPANPKYQPMPILDNSIELIGPFVSLLRPPM